MHIKGNGIDKTFDKYSKEIDFILKTGENTIIQNQCKYANRCSIVY